jgi:hypothetical protein
MPSILVVGSRQLRQAIDDFISAHNVCDIVIPVYKKGRGPSDVLPVLVLAEQLENPDRHRRDVGDQLHADAQYD